MRSDHLSLPALRIAAFRFARFVQHGPVCRAVFEALAGCRVAWPCRPRDRPCRRQCLRAGCSAGDIRIGQAFATPTPPGVEDRRRLLVGERTRASRRTGWSGPASPAASRVELHNGRDRRRRRDAHARTRGDTGARRHHDRDAARAAAMHLMLMELAKPLVRGRIVPDDARVRTRRQGRGQVKVQAAQPGSRSTSTAHEPLRSAAMAVVGGRGALGALARRSGRAPGCWQFMQWLRDRARPCLRRLSRAVAMVGRRPAAPSGRRSGSSSTSRRMAIPSVVLASDRMPGARWFPGVRLNYAEHAFRHASARPAGTDLPRRRSRAGRQWAGTQLQADAGALAAFLRRSVCRPGDRVVSYMPNTPQTVTAFLACASIGAVWSSCSPDMGPSVVLDRFRQIEPVVLFAVDGYSYNGKSFDRRAAVDELLAQLPSRAMRGARRRERAAPATTRRRPRCSGATRSTGAKRSRSRRRWRSRGCPSTIRYGSSIPPARPACRRRWSIRMAASSSPTSRPSSCSTTCAPATACCSSAAPAGSCGTSWSAACCAARPSCSTTATRPGPIRGRCGASWTSMRSRISAAARPT